MKLYDEYLKRLIAVNDEQVPTVVHEARDREFTGWKAGIHDASGAWYNGDFYYLDLVNRGEMEPRDMVCGVFSDWQEKPQTTQPVGPPGSPAA